MEPETTEDGLTQQSSPRFSVAGKKEIKPRTTKFDKKAEGKITRSTNDTATPHSTTGDGSYKDSAGDDSIKVTVKSRKRKRTAWKMVNGVEMRVAISDSEPETTPNPKAPSKKTKGPKQAAQPKTPPPVLPHLQLQPGAAGVEMRGTWNQNAEPMMRDLPPLDVTRVSPRSGPKIGQLEPPVTSPVERMTISARVSVPPPSTRIPNPFAIHQPLIGHFSYPQWMNRSVVPRQDEVLLGGQAPAGSGKARADEEAAMVLSMLHRGASGPT